MRLSSMSTGNSSRHQYTSLGRKTDVESHRQGSSATDKSRFMSPRLNYREYTIA